MNYQKLYNPIKVLALLSCVAVAITYWLPNEIVFYLMLLPYPVLFFVSTEKNYRTAKLAIIRLIPAVITLLLVPFLLFVIEPDPQAGIGLAYILIIQLASISAAECLVLFYINDKSSA